MTVDLIYWIVGVGLLTVVANMVLETLEKGNYKNLVNLTGTIIIFAKLIPAIMNLFKTAEVFLRW